MIYDVILVTGESYADHPLNAAGVLKRVLESEGFSTGIIEKPDWNRPEDFSRLGAPRLFFGVSSGSVDSLLRNYTPLLKKRSEDPHTPFISGIPDRCVIVYCSVLKSIFKKTPVVIGGVESSLRRFSHYDYLSGKVRRSILLDSKADILVYGAGELPIVDIARCFSQGIFPSTVPSTCTVSKILPSGYTLLPAHEETVSDSNAFCRLQKLLSNSHNLAQPEAERYVLQNKSALYTSADLDRIYSLPFSRKIPENAPELKSVQFSVISHRGCSGNCNFCSIALHFGSKVVSRSHDSILQELDKISFHKEFRGYIDDLGGPSANMFQMDCSAAPDCKGNCLSCKKQNYDHSGLISLLEKADRISRIKKIFIRSGIRFDLAVRSEEYIRRIALRHTSGCLKIAPEHCSDNVLRLMNKSLDGFQEFSEIFNHYNTPLNQHLRYYFLTAHPGSTIKDAKKLKNFMDKLKNTESVQIFTPTPMTVSTCMYHTGLNPFTMEDIYIPRSFQEKKLQKRLLFS